MIFTPLTSEHNRELCALESTILMLKIANMQYRKATETCSEGTIRYFEEKNDVYAELRSDIYAQIWEDYYLDELNFSKKLELAQNSLWRKFQRSFPECALSFEEVFKDGECVYAPFVQQQERVLKGEVEPTERFADLTGLYSDYQTAFVDYNEFLNFKTMMFAINAQVIESGAEPWIAPTLDEKVAYVPIWAVEEFFNSAQNLGKQVKKDYVKFGMEYVKADRRAKKHPDNAEYQTQLEEYAKQQEVFSSRVTNLEDMVMEGDHIYERVGARVQKWGTVEVGSIIFEKIREFFTDIPDEIKAITPQDGRILSLRSEIENMINAGLMELPTVESSLVLGMYAGVPCKFDLDNYEYSKQVIAALLENVKDNIPERARLIAENQTAISAKKLKENNQVIAEIDDCFKAMGYARFETPFGLVGIKNGKLVNVQTGQVFELSELDKYSVEEGKVVVNPFASTLNTGKDSGGKQ